MTQHLNPVRLILATLLFTSPFQVSKSLVYIIDMAGKVLEGPGRDIQACQKRPAVYNINHQRSRTIAQILKIYQKHFLTKFENLPNFLIMNLNHGERGLELPLCHLAEFKIFLLLESWIKNVQNAMDGN